VGVAGETYMIPVDTVVECVDLPEDVETHGNGHGIFSLRGEPLPFVELRRHFHLGGDQPARQQVVVLRHAGGLAGIAVDTLFGETQTVIKPLGTLFAALPGIAGSAILGNGRVALILDVESLIRRVLEKTLSMAQHLLSTKEALETGAPS